MAPVFAEWADYDYVWFEGWNKRQVLRVDQTTGAGVNYELKINVTWTEDYRSDFKDLRITYLNGTDLKWWIEQLAEGSFCALWLKVPVDLDAESFECFWWSQNPIADTYYNSSATDVFKRVISSGVVLALPMDEALATDNCVDYSGNTNTGTPVGTTIVSDGKFGNCRGFNGVDNWAIHVTDSASLRGMVDWTLLSYVRPHAWTPEWYGVVDAWAASGGFQNRYMLGYPTGGNLYAWVANNGGAATDNKAVANPSLNNWHLFGGILDGGNTLGTIMDGVVSTKATTIANINANPPNGWIIRIGKYSGQYMHGDIAGVFMFNVTLSQDEIDDFNDYYPQCSSANFGSLFFRTYVSGGVSYSFIVMEDTSNMDYIYLVGLLGVIGVSLVLFKLKLGVVGLVWGIFGIAIAASMAGNQAVPFYPYLTLGVAVIGTLLVLYSGYEMRGAS